MTPDELVNLYKSPDELGDPPALRGMEDASWSALDKPNYNIPALLRALVSGTWDHQDCARQDLYWAICHQGTVCLDTAVALPFLINLLEDDSCQNKPDIAELVANIATGSPPFAGCDGNPQELARREAIFKRPLQADIEAGRQLAANIRRQIAARIDLLVPYLRDRNPSVREAVARAFGVFPEVARRLGPKWEQLLKREREQFVRSALEEVIASVKSTGPAEPGMPSPTA